MASTSSSPIPYLSLNELQQFGSNLGDRILTCLKCNKLSKIPIQITTSGIWGPNESQVTDLKIETNLAKLIQSFPNVSPETQIEPEKKKQIIYELREFALRRRLETLITSIIRFKGCKFDCAKILLRKNEEVVILLRKSAELTTQQPQEFKSLITEKFEPIIEVKQGEYAITSPKSEKPILATWHFADCVGFAGYIPEHKIGVLAHIDDVADVEDLFLNIKQRIASAFTDAKTSIVMDYVLIGGKTGCGHREKIIEEAKKVCEEDFIFLFRECVGEKISHLDSSMDSSWGVSMRLARSIALDTRCADPLKELKSYEPNLYDESSLHQRKRTVEEANEFERKRAEDKVLKLVYNFFENEPSVTVSSGETSSTTASSSVDDLK